MCTTFMNIMIQRDKTHLQITIWQIDNDSTFTHFFKKVKTFSNFKFHFKHYYQQHKSPSTQSLSLLSRFTSQDRGLMYSIFTFHVWWVSGDGHGLFQTLFIRICPIVYSLCFKFSMIFFSPLYLSVFSSFSLPTL
jgi:hypothetical protein